MNLPPGGAKVFRQPEVQLEGIETVPEIIQLTDEAAVDQVWNRAGTMTLSVRMMLQSPGLYSIWMSGSNGRSTGSKVRPKSRDRNNRNPPVSETSPVSITWIQHRIELWKDSSPRPPQQRCFVSPALASPFLSGLDWWQCRNPCGWRCGLSGESHPGRSSHSLRWHGERAAVRAADQSNAKRYPENATRSVTVQVFLTSCRGWTGQNAPWTAAPETLSTPAAPGGWEQRHQKQSHPHPSGFVSFTFQVTNSLLTRRPPRPETANSWSSL